MERSSGIILYRKRSDKKFEFFVCTPDGPYWENRELWNFPKGHVEGDESDFECAIREFQEETSILLNKDATYLDLGIIKQNTKKVVHVYAKHYDNEDTSNCYSNECASIVNGVKIIHREIKDYAWKTIEELEINGMKCYLPIFRQIENCDYCY